MRRNRSNDCIEELNSRLRNRLRRQYCEIPSIAKPFATHEKRRKKERNLQFPAVKKIWAKIGVVVPVGTGITFVSFYSKSEVQVHDFLSIKYN